MMEAYGRNKYTSTGIIQWMLNNAWPSMIWHLYDWYREVASKNLPARLQEKALVDFFAGHSEEISRRAGKKIDLAQQKPYTGTHNSGYTECQEFFGAITLDSHEHLGNQIVTMLDVALRGIGDRWNDVVIPASTFASSRTRWASTELRSRLLLSVPSVSRKWWAVRRLSLARIGGLPQQSAATGTASRRSHWTNSCHCIAVTSYTEKPPEVLPTAT